MAIQTLDAALQDSRSHDAQTPAPLVQVTGLESQYHTARGPVPALRGVDLEIGVGESVALVGESGSGKSTLSHALIGLLPDNAELTAGSIRYRDQELIGASDAKLRSLRGAQIGLIPQDPTVSLNPVYTIGHQLVEAVRAHERIPKKLARVRALELLDTAGIDRPWLRFGQYPHQISGGMRQRVLIAIALAGQPQLLIADEPTSALDASVQKRILDHLQQLISERGIALLLVTHDLAVAAERTDRLVVMQQGRIVESGPVEQILNQPVDDYTRRLLAAAPVFNQDSVQPPAPVAEDVPVLLEVTQLHKSFKIAGATEAEAEVEGGAKATRPGSWRRWLGTGTHRITAVDEVSFQLRRGETLALVGESGSGKSTTARLVLGLEEADSGSVRFEGEELTAASRARWRALRRRAQLIYQNPFASLDPRWTIAQIVAEPLDAYGIGTRAESRQQAVELLDRVTLGPEFADRKPAELSGGQRQRVAIARALALNPDLVVCDEPVSALDVSIQAQVLELLAELQEQQGLTYLFITHDLAVVRQLAHRVLVMRHGRIVEAGETAQIFAHPSHDYTRTLLASISGATLLDRAKN